MDVKSSEYQKRLRVRLCLFAYAYEYEADSLISDHEFDRLCLLVDLNVKTDNSMYDLFFKQSFLAHTGQWIRQHPEPMLLQRQYKRVKEAIKCLTLD